MSSVAPVWHPRLEPLHQKLHCHAQFRRALERTQEQERRLLSDLIEGPTNMRILIVDDHRELAQTLDTLIESSAVPLTVGIGFNGFQAIQLAQCHPPAVAFLDTQMPGTNGAQAAAAIGAALVRGLPSLVAVTGDPDQLMAAALTGLPCSVLPTQGHVSVQQHE
jgi:CheY-like chemotaxis protein